MVKIVIEAGADAVRQALREARLEASGAVRLSPDQQLAVDAVVAWFENGTGDIRIGGLAGTGKTTIAAQVPRELGLRSGQVAYCAPTGKAARVLTGKLRDSGSPSAATTIHHLMYQPDEVHCRSCPSAGNDTATCHRRKDSTCGCELIYERVQELDPDLRVIIVDEASMVDEEIYADLTSFGVPIVWIGDHGQLPPVRGSLDLMSDLDVRLEKIHRQAEGSAILQLARLAREGSEIPYGAYGPHVRKLKADEHELTLDTDDGELLILCGFNRTRVRLNASVRRQLGYPDDKPVAGDRVICLRNNHRAGIHNGMLGTLKRVRSMGSRLAVEIDLDGEDDSYRGEISRDQFGNRETLNERGVDLWDYGYCLTVHKAMGSESERVVLIDEWRWKDRRRWLYTAITRAKRELTIIG